MCLLIVPISIVEVSVAKRFPVQSAQCLIILCCFRFAVERKHYGFP